MSWFSKIVERAKETIIEIGASVANLGTRIEERISEYLGTNTEVSEVQDTTMLADLDYRKPFLSEQEALDYLADIAAPSRIVKTTHTFVDPDTGEIDETALYYPVIEDSP